MSYKERIPGMEPDNRTRNIIVGGGYGLLLLFLLANFVSVIALLIFLSPVIVAVIVGKNYKDSAVEMARLPGINAGGGIQTGISAFVYTIVVAGILMGSLTAIVPVDDSPEEDAEVPEGEGEAEAEAAEDEAEAADDMKTVTITVVDENGDPVKNADVEFVHDDAIILDTRENKPTNSDGVVTFETEAGSNVDVNVEADGYENTDASLTVSEDEEITLTLQEDTEDGETDAAEEGDEAAEDEMKTVTVAIVDENGDPIENADVEFVHDDAILLDTRENKQTGSDGIVSFETETDSNVDINVEADGYENTDASLTVSEDEEITLTLQEEPEETGQDTESTEEDSDDTSVEETEGTEATDGSSETSDASGESDESDSSSDESENPDVTVVNEELQETPIGWELIVTVENTSGEMQDYIEVKAEFYDEEGVRIDEWFANATDVEDGERVELTISTTQDEEPADYELEASTDPF